MIKVELIAAAGCTKCAAQSESLKAAAESAARGRVEWREVNVLDEIDYVVNLGVLTLPALAINGKLVFKVLPSADELRREVSRYANGADA